MNYWFYIFEPRNEEIDPKKISHFKTQLIRLMQLRKESRSGAFSCNIKERFPTFRLFDTLSLSPDRRLEFLLLLFFNKMSNSERFSYGFFWVLAFKIPQRMPKRAKPRIVFLLANPFLDWDNPDCLDFRDSRTNIWKNDWSIHRGGGGGGGGGSLLPIMTGRLLLKVVPFSRFRYLKGLGFH